MYLKFQHITQCFTADWVQTTTISHLDGSNWLASISHTCSLWSVLSTAASVNLFIRVRHFRSSHLMLTGSHNHLQPLSLITLAFSLQPWPFHYRFRQQERACAVALRAPSSFFLEPASHWLQAVLPLLSLRPPASPALPSHSESPSPSSVFLHNTCWHLRHPTMSSHFWGMLSFMEFGAFCV